MVLADEYKATEKRRFPRHVVSWQGGCQHGDRVVWGRILDINVGGVFLQPESAFLAGSRGFTGTPMQALELGDQTVLTYSSDVSEDTVRVLATVCWKGSSSLHGCPGLGLRFEALG